LRPRLAAGLPLSWRRERGSCTQPQYHTLVRGRIMCASAQRQEAGFVPWEPSSHALGVLSLHNSAHTPVHTDQDRSVAPSCCVYYYKATVPTMCTYGGGGGRCPRYIVRADRHTNCGESSGGPKGVTNGFSSMIQKRARLIQSRSRTAPRVAASWTVRILRSHQPRRRIVLRSLR
jgi:hypothetical protein